MAALLSFYTRLLALIALALAGLWGWLAWSAPDATYALFGSDILIWGPSVWFGYLAVRFGLHRLAARFYFGAMRPLGRLGIALFGVLTIGTMALGGLAGIVIAFPQFAELVVRWGLLSGLIAASLYVIIAHFGARPLVYGTGFVHYEGEPVLRPGARLGGARYPYRG
ncbi:MAG: hypothetical protein AAF566_01670 [Pseudomonadota bacterium]